MDITILDTSIRQDSEGRFSLNDLHRAAMKNQGRSGNPNKDHQSPANFLRTASVKAFIAALDAEVSDQHICRSLVTVKGGSPKDQGTFASELVVLRYAGWISPEFEIKAYRALKQLQDARRLGVPADLYAQALAIEKDEAKSAALASQAARVMRARRKEKPILTEKLAILRDMVQLCISITSEK